jgi:hypothetical protein
MTTQSAPNSAALTYDHSIHSAEQCAPSWSGNR